MKFNGKRWIVSAAVVPIVVAAVTAFAQTGAVGPVVKPVGVATLAGGPVPDGAAQATSVGRGALEVTTGNNSPKDTDSSWVAKFDLDGNGAVDETTFVWDDEDRVLFAYSDGAFTCKNGDVGTGAMLIATNAAGNPRGRAAGSGFWVAELDESECGAAAAGLMGCRFDASGKETACGAVTINAKTDDITVVTVKK